jgi:beta-glucosidase
MLNHPDIAPRVEALLARMSLDQKIGQMTQTERMAITPAEVKTFHIGSVLSGGGSAPGDNLPTDWVNMNDAYWAASMEADENHLAIPIIYGVDAIHGNNNVLGATVFPHNIGLGAANDPDLIERIARVTAEEILATGVEWTFAPTLAVAQDHHWGRTYESYSENPALVASYAARFVQGLQGNLGDDSVVACVKHWVGDGGTTHGIDQGETTLIWDQLESTHMTPYYPALQAGVMTVMVSFNSWNGDKCHGSHYLLTEVLKHQLDFNGYIISDWDGIDYLSESYCEAIAMSVNAGIDMFMVSENWRSFIDHLRWHVERGNVAMARIDDAVRRILSVKFAYGLFEKPRPLDRPWSNDPGFGGAVHREVACEAVRKSLVLLKNESRLLPLQPQARILVAGKNAHNRGHQCGGFTVAWQGATDNETIIGGSSIWEGIEAIASQATLDIDGTGADSAAHDVGIVVIGETPYAEGMGDIRDGDDVIIQAGSQIKGLLKVLEPYGSSLTLNQLHPEDLQTITNISDQGIPVVVVLITGRPLLIDSELDAATAFVAAWLPGSEGQGIAQVLFGEHDFTGKLSFTWPAQEDSTLFPLGYGLTY